MINLSVGATSEKKQVKGMIDHRGKNKLSLTHKHKTEINLPSNESGSNTGTHGVPTSWSREALDRDRRQEKEAG